MKILKSFLKLIIVITFLWASYTVIEATPYYIEKVHYEPNEIRFVIDDTEKTKSLPDPIVIENEDVLLSIDTVRKFFDKYAYYDEKYNTVIIAKDTSVYKMPIDSNQIVIDGINKTVDIPTKFIGEKIYIPIKELSVLYGLDVKYNEKVIVDTGLTNSYTIKIGDGIRTKKYKRELSLTTGSSKKNKEIYVFDDEYQIKSPNEYVWVRTENGSLGYVRKDKIEAIEEKNNMIKLADNTEIPKINLIWEYAEIVTPNRHNESKKEGIDVISPTWIYVKNTNGDLKENISNLYLEWAKETGYEVWPTIKNDYLEDLVGTSELVTDMHNRENFINQVLDVCKKYNLKGINVDFEYMYKKDRDAYSELIRELSAVLRKNGIIVSVDVNVPDGSDNWSLCYDSKALSDAVDYIMVMTYDQYGVSSKKSGPVASLTWVDTNLDKMINRDKIDSRKLLMGIPFYSRYWKLKNGSKVGVESLDMTKAENYLKKYKDSATWDEELGQYVIKFSAASSDIEIYIENKESVAEKIKLVDKYNLAGYAIWQRAQASEKIWDVIK